MEKEMQSITLGDGSQSFTRVAFDSCQPKMAFQSKEDREAGKPKVQDTNNDNLPKWQVRINATFANNGFSDYLLVSVASAENPAEEFATGDLIAFDNLSVGANGYRDKPGFSWFYFARGIVRAGVPAKV